MDNDWNTVFTGGIADGFTKDIYSTHYGNQYFSSSIGNPTFVTHGTNTAFSTTFERQNDTPPLFNTKGIITGNSADYALTDDNKAAGYLGIYFYLNHQTDFTLNNANDFFTHYKDMGNGNVYYKGTTAYGLVLGGFGPTA